jgi:hypothetical protein
MTAQASPKTTINGVADAIVFCERKVEHLTGRIDERKNAGQNASWDEKERDVVRKAILAFRLHRDEIEDEDRATLALSAVLDLLDQIKLEVTMNPALRQEVESTTLRIRTLIGNLED